jgi:hypothetical protein
VHAPYLRSTQYKLAITFALLASLTIAATASAQSARTAIAIPAALATSDHASGPAQQASRCETVFSATVDDSSGVADDIIDDDTFSPGSGMVVVDSHGKIIDSEPPRVTRTPTVPAACCAESPGGETDRTASGTTRSYTGSNGSVTRARCIDAIKPPPSSRSPL